LCLCNRHDSNSFLVSKLVKIWLILCSICLASCNITRYVQEDAHLLKKNVLKVYIDKRASQKADINYQLNNLIQPKPNAKLFGVFIPYKLIAFNNQADRKQGDTSLVKMTKMREKPVIYDSSIVLQTITNMNTLLFNKGFFDSYIKDTVIVRNRKAKVLHKRC
jgi:predicted small secreted protein